MKIAGMIFLNGATSYEWQIGPIFGSFTKLRYWWRCPTWRGGKITYWTHAIAVGWDDTWRLNGT